MNMLYLKYKVAFSSGELIVTTGVELNTRGQAVRCNLKSSSIAGVTFDVEPLERSMAKLIAERYIK